MIRRVVICLCAACMSFSLHADGLKPLLKRLDKLVDDKALYADLREKRIDDMKVKLAAARNPERKVELAHQINLEYIVYQTDSALTYAKLMYRYANESGNRSRIVEAAVNVSRVLDVMGQYAEALDVLEEIDDDIPAEMRTQFVYCKQTIYNSLKDYSLDLAAKGRYAALADVYRDSLLTRYPLSYNERVFLTAEEMICKEQYEEAKQQLQEAYDRVHPDSRDAGIIAYSLGWIYDGLGDRNEAEKFFAKSAIADLCSGVKQHRSLNILSKMLYAEGDIDRAYKYAKSSMEDYIYCNARLRTLDTSDFFVLIDDAYQLKQRQSSIIKTVFFIIVSVLFVSLLVILVYLSRINRRLHLANRKISDVIAKLNDANKIKEEYIGLYMNHCSVYIDKMNLIKNKLNKNLRKGVDHQKIMEEIDDVINISDEVKDFYRTFDMTILHLFPNFPAKLDQLLVPEARGIYSKTESGLSPEYRIFACIRLGLTDSVKIAQFLRYSLSTIYNYRTKLRNKALGRREDFEKAVMRIDRNVGM